MRAPSETPPLYAGYFESQAESSINDQSKFRFCMADFAVGKDRSPIRNPLLSRRARVFFAQQVHHRFAPVVEPLERTRRMARERVGSDDRQPDG